MMTKRSRISGECLHEMQKAFEEYRAEVELCGYTESTQWSYLYHGEAFLRWLEYDFTPGETFRKIKFDGGN